MIDRKEKEQLQELLDLITAQCNANWGYDEIWKKEMRFIVVELDEIINGEGSDDYEVWRAESVDRNLDSSAI